MADGFRRARNEALTAFAVWAVALVVTVGGSWLLASAPAASLWGLPRWLVLGILAPWVFFFAVNVWFTLSLMGRGEE